MSKLRALISVERMKRKWRKNNLHNSTKMKNIFPQNLVSVGNACYGDLYVHSNNSQTKLFIGNYCSIGDNTVFLLSADHGTSYISTFPCCDF